MRDDGMKRWWLLGCCFLVAFVHGKIDWTAPQGEFKRQVDRAFPKTDEGEKVKLRHYAIYNQYILGRVMMGEKLKDKLFDVAGLDAQELQTIKTIAPVHLVVWLLGSPQAPRNNNWPTYVSEGLDPANGWYKQPAELERLLAINFSVTDDEFILPPNTEEARLEAFFNGTAFDFAASRFSPEFSAETVEGLSPLSLLKSARGKTWYNKGRVNDMLDALARLRDKRAALKIVCAGKKTVDEIVAASEIPEPLRDSPFVISALRIETNSFVRQTKSYYEQPALDWLNSPENIDAYVTTFFHFNTKFGGFHGMETFVKVLDFTKTRPAFGQPGFEDALKKQYWVAYFNGGSLTGDLASITDERGKRKEVARILARVSADGGKKTPTPKTTKIDEIDRLAGMLKEIGGVSVN